MQSPFRAAHRPPGASPNPPARPARRPAHRHRRDGPRTLPYEAAQAVPSDSPTRLRWRSLATVLLGPQPRIESFGFNLSQLGFVADNEPDLRQSLPPAVRAGSASRWQPESPSRLPRIRAVPQGHHQSRRLRQVGKPVREACLRRPRCPVRSVPCRCCSSHSWLERVSRIEHPSCPRQRTVHPFRPVPSRALRFAGDSEVSSRRFRETRQSTCCTGHAPGQPARR